MGVSKGNFDRIFSFNFRTGCAPPEENDAGPRDFQFSAHLPRYLRALSLILSAVVPRYVSLEVVVDAYERPFGAWRSLWEEKKPPTYVASLRHRAYKPLRRAGKVEAKDAPITRYLGRE